jgi:sugar lactone lactonase YvrE
MFNTTSGYLSVQDDTLQIPNGVAFSPDYSILYVTDTGALNANMGLPLDSQGHRTVSNTLIVLILGLCL